MILTKLKMYVYAHCYIKELKPIINDTNCISLTFLIVKTFSGPIAKPFKFSDINPKYNYETTDIIFNILSSIFCKCWINSCMKFIK